MNFKIPFALLFVLAPLLSVFHGAEIVNLHSRSVSGAPLPKEKYRIDVKESVVTWKGSMALGQGGHTGYVSISNGELVMNETQLIAGSVVVDMTTIADEKHGRENGLVDHLKNPDFFDVQQFPIAVFVITNVAAGTGETLNVMGNMTIKQITNVVTFPAKVDVKEGVVTATGKLTIDRTKWEVRYKSGKFFGNLADEAIADDIEFDLKIVAKK